MKTKSKNFGNRRSLYLSFGLFNQIRDQIVMKNTTKIYFVLFMPALILPMIVQTYFSTNNQCCADLVLYIIYLRIIYSLLKKKIYNNGFHNVNGRTQGKSNRSTHNMRSRTHVKTGHGNTCSFNRTGSVGGRFQGGQRGGHR